MDVIFRHLDQWRHFPAYALERPFSQRFAKRLLAWHIAAGATPPANVREVAK